MSRCREARWLSINRMRGCKTSSRASRLLPWCIAAERALVGGTRMRWDDGLHGEERRSLILPPDKATVQPHSLTSRRHPPTLPRSEKSDGWTQFTMDMVLCSLRFSARLGREPTDCPILMNVDVARWQRPVAAVLELFLALSLFLLWIHVPDLLVTSYLVTQNLRETSLPPSIDFKEGGVGGVRWQPGR